MVDLFVLVCLCTGEHLKRYLEPVLKKCGLERKPLKSASSDVDEGCVTRRNSFTESSHELSESETEFSSVGTPATPTGGRRSSDTFLAPTTTKLYPVSSLHLRCGGSTPSSLTESPLSLVSPHTPSSLDSGVASLRGGGDRFRPHPLKYPPGRSPPVPPPLPPNEAPPLDAPPPPLPPQSPRLPNTHIENISSDEEGPPIVRDPRRASLSRPSVDVLSPVSISPPFSPRLAPRAPNHTRSHVTFADPSLGLQTFVSTPSIKNEAPPSVTPSYETLPTVTSVTPSYEPEVEDISGDESPVMVYNSTPSYDIQVYETVYLHHTYVRTDAIHITRYSHSNVLTCCCVCVSG